jgi:TRAP-type C4-dicarboxylate transport system permease large subunit
MVFMLLICATTFSLVFRGFSGDVYFTHLLSALPGGTIGPVAVVMAVCFGLGFFLDALEIIFLVVPIAMPPLLFLGVDPVWLAVLTAINLQTSFTRPSLRTVLHATSRPNRSRPATSVGAPYSSLCSDRAGAGLAPAGHRYRIPAPEQRRLSLPGASRPRGR